jgi:phage terminase large subunit-like protein
LSNRSTPVVGIIRVNPSGLGRDTCKASAETPTGITRDAFVVLQPSQHSELKDGHFYVLDDVTAGGSPDTWGRAAVAAYDRLRADRIVGEQNNGGAMVEAVIRAVSPRISYKAVFASRGKRTRAEPVAALYEQGRCHHVGVLGALENELCTWTPDEDESPNRMDALVWAVSELMESGPVVVAIPVALPKAPAWSRFDE